MMTAKRKRSIEGVLFDWDGTLNQFLPRRRIRIPGNVQELEISWGFEELEKNYSPNWYEVYRARGLAAQALGQMRTARGARTMQSTGRS